MLSLHDHQIVLSVLNQLVELINMLSQECLLSLQLLNVIGIPLAFLLHAFNLSVKANEFTVLVPDLLTETVEFSIFTDLRL